jgi:hypothetical protein
MRIRCLDTGEPNACDCPQLRVYTEQEQEYRGKSKQKEKQEQGQTQKVEAMHVILRLLSLFTQSSPVKCVKHGVYAILINTPV